jgi:heat shock protein HslJ
LRLIHHLTEDYPLNDIRAYALCVCLAASPSWARSEPPADNTADVEPPSFSARGNEPGWLLQITDDAIRLDLDYGQRRIEAPLPPAQQSDGTTVYALQDQGIRVTIRDQRCNDDMTGMPYPATVSIDDDGRPEGSPLRGCGGEPSDLLEGPEWRVTSIAGEPVPDDVSVTLEFLEQGRVAGSSGCNRMMGSYTLTGEGLSFGALAGTMMACPEPQMQIEKRFLDHLQQVVRFDLDPDGGLVLATGGGDAIEAER